MASGKLGSADLTANTYITVYTVPSSTISTVNINMTNRGADVAEVRVAITSEATTPLDADFIEYDVTIPSSGILERTALIAGANEKVMAYSTTTDVSVRVHGLEEAS